MATKNERIGVRLPSDMKDALLSIAKREGRSLAQVCELILRAGITDYEKEGPEYLRRVLRSKEKGK